MYHAAKTTAHGEPHGRRGLFGWFKRHFNRNADRYERGLAGILRKGGRWLLLCPGIIILMAFLFLRLPTSFLPLEDRGVFLTSVQLPAGAPLAQTARVVVKVENLLSY